MDPIEASDGHHRIMQFGLATPTRTHLAHAGASSKLAKVATWGRK